MITESKAMQMLAELKPTVETLDRQAHATAIKTDDDLKVATEFLTKLSIATKQVKADKEEITKPLNEALRSVRELFAPVEKKLENATLFIKSAMQKYHNAVAAKADKKEATIVQKIETGKMTLEQGVEKMADVKRIETTVKTDTGAAVTFRTQRSVEVVNPLLVPREYLMLDMVAIRREALKGTAIPGVEVREEKIPVVGR